MTAAPSKKDNDDPWKVFAFEAADFIRSQLHAVSPGRALFITIKAPYGTMTDADNIVHRTGQQDDDVTKRLIVCSFIGAIEDTEPRPVSCIECLTIAT